MSWLLPEEKKIILLSSIGGALEFYDFLIFIYVSSSIASVFFPSASPTLAMLASLTVFAVSYFVRPIGGMVLSHFGDTLGRKSTFLVSLILMAVPTVIIACLPGYAKIGLLAPILLIVCRFIQGFAVGGEIPGAIVYCVEHVRPGRRNFACAAIFAGLNLGLLLAQGVVGFLQYALNPEQFLSWGWRLTFLLGCVTAVVGTLLRNNMSESPVFLLNEHKIARPLVLLFKEYKTRLLIGISITAIQAVLIYALYIFMPNYLLQLANITLSVTTINLLNFINLSVYTLAILAMGAVSDRLGARRLLSFGTKGLIAFSIAGYALIASGGLFALALAMLLFTVFSAAIAASVPSITAGLFPAAIRYSGVGACYNLAYAIFGGTTPLIIMALLDKSHMPLSPAFYLTFIALMTLVGISQLKSARVSEALHGASEPRP